MRTGPDLAEACQIATDAYNELRSGIPDHEGSATALYKLNDLLPKLYTQAEAA